MNYVLLVILMVSHLSRAQSKVTGLGDYKIGLTTPDSLSRSAFREEDQSYVKGTIALPCTHIRTFTAATVTIAGVSVANLVLVFYDNRLFRLSCDYSDSLKAAFTVRHGAGVRWPVSRFQFCPTGNDTPMLMWGERWPHDDVLTLVVYRKGFTTDCRWEQGTRLVILGRSLAALSSDCDVQPADPFVEEFIR